MPASKKNNSNISIVEKKNSNGMVVGFGNKELARKLEKLKKLSKS